jgi:hypothetical protein
MLSLEYSKSALGGIEILQHNIWVCQGLRRGSLSLERKTVCAARTRLALKTFLNRLVFSLALLTVWP